ncbi:MAG: SDR family NAD(P)-dependent oxidoreductase, partial [Pseudomonadota bacterium]
MPNQPKTIVIAGGSAGVGRATAEHFARDGHNLVLIARGKERLDNAERDLTDYGVKILTIGADVADAQAMTAARDQIVDRFGAIDIWINCAMATVFGPFKDISAA